MTTHKTPSAKERVLQWVRSKNPATMELKFGCKVIGMKDRTLYRRDEHTPAYKMGRKDDRCRQQGRDYECLGILICKGDRNRKAWYIWDQRNNAPSRLYGEPSKVVGSDMGSNELMIALGSGYAMMHSGQLLSDKKNGMWLSTNVMFDRSQNLHNQKPEFYESILPLLP